MSFSKEVWMLYGATSHGGTSTVKLRSLGLGGGEGEWQ